MPYQKQEPQTFRQFGIIKRLYALEELQGSLVAQEYGVSARTLLRDMRKIATVIPIIGKNGMWSLDIDKLNKHSNQLADSLLSSFAKNIDIDITCFEKSNLSENKVSFAIEYRYLPKNLGEQIIKAMEDEVRCAFTYFKVDSITQREIDPIKLYTENGRWYIISRDYKDDKVKTFLLSKIKHFKVLALPNTLTSSMIDDANNMKSVWASNHKEEFKVKLYISPKIRHYITDIKLHKSQEIVDRHHDGGLEVDCSITHKLEILPAIKSWLPYIHILEPKWLKEDLMSDLKYYKDVDLKMDI